MITLFNKFSFTIILFFFVTSCTTFHSIDNLTHTSLAEENSFYKVTNGEINLMNNIKSINPVGIIGEIHFDNSLFNKNLRKFLSINKFREYTLSDESSKIDILIEGRMVTTYAPEQYIGGMLLFIIPTKLDTSKITMNIDVKYMEESIFSFSIEETIDTWIWAIPLFPLFEEDYNQKLAEKISKIIIKGFNDTNVLSKINEIDADLHHTFIDEESNTDEEEIIALGSGFVVSHEGYIVTNAHVIEGGAHYTFKLNDLVFNLELVEIDKINDIAILKTSSKEDLPYLKLNFNPISLGENVYTIGFPNPLIQGIEPKYTAGNINSMKGVGDDNRYYQISVPIQPGNSGGPLLNEAGDVIGIVTASLSDLAIFESTGQLPQNVNYALKVETLANILLVNGKYTLATTPSNISISEVVESVGLIMVYN